MLALPTDGRPKPGLSPRSSVRVITMGIHRASIYTEKPRPLMSPDALRIGNSDSKGNGSSAGQGSNNNSPFPRQSPFSSPRMSAPVSPFDGPKRTLGPRRSAGAGLLSLHRSPLVTQRGTRHSAHASLMATSQPSTSTIISIQNSPLVSPRGPRRSTQAALLTLQQLHQQDPSIPTPRGSPRRSIGKSRSLLRKFADPASSSSSSSSRNPANEGHEGESAPGTGDGRVGERAGDVSGVVVGETSIDFSKGAVDEEGSSPPVHGPQKDNGKGWFLARKLKQLVINRALSKKVLTRWGVFEPQWMSCLRKAPNREDRCVPMLLH